MTAEDTHDKWMIYGANGYTGELMAEEAARRGMRPILAGRREEAIGPIAERLGLAHRVFTLGGVDEVAPHLEDVAALLLAAGPFSKTSARAVQACLETGTHYLDITGEIPVFEAAHAKDEIAKKRGVVLMPGVGFDVVPTDCLAAALHRALPDATELVLAFRGVGSPSPGTMKTMVEGAAEGGAVRRDGKIVQTPTAHRTRTIPFRDKSREAVCIPWGDVSTAYHSTGIGNIEVYMAMPPRMIRMAKMGRYFKGVLGNEHVQSFLKKRIDARVTGPSEQERRSGRSQLWGRVANAAGRSVEATLETPEGYHLTMLTGVESAHRVARGDVSAGAHTPSSAFGPDFILEFEGCTLEMGEPRS